MTYGEFCSMLTEIVRLREEALPPDALKSEEPLQRDDAALALFEAALAMGYTKIQTFFKIIFPQAARNFLPVLKGEFISMVKMTSVVGYIAVQDLTKVSDIIRSRTMEAFFPLIVTAIIYFALANVMTAMISLVERRIEPKRRKRTVKGVRMICQNKA